MKIRALPHDLFRRLPWRARCLINKFFPISEKRFVERYAAYSKWTVEAVLHELEIFRCDCGDELCRGWKTELKPRWWYSAHAAAGGCHICRPGSAKTARG